ncbi:formate dehydrogenase subunit gamma [Pseudochrobactrum saccharolyticum]|uniref:Formate dehydrogenase subunit gamma n=1 Tax=Pseudochrobactrum saccharolyticum TaxID=354352 RepID=A0A7W8EQU8_9HYPH|nr:formate dehydrogenase subunit gamma [Pseudochrobactrum saccharolyticum]KAB0537244.1 formate dehydrogenase subunit gamma [Pseudochrobactrum saccharolyticum]MBB5092281.1 formate dehydrogenase subunit gamma [Pseudochrobactrum saccharolyticum]MDP8252679.1 formate dehydrogenase subunit gamma [Pseudochrobactrum saccharolyticum]
MSGSDSVFTRSAGTSSQKSDVAERTIDVINEYKAIEGPLLPVLHAIQEEFGYVPAETLTLIAEALNLSRAEVHGVMTFYHDFRASPTGRHVIRLCRAEACQSMDGDRVAEAVQKLLGIGWGETTGDGKITLEAVYCLGLCACAPAAQVDDRLIGRLNEGKAERMIAEARA